MSSSETPPIAAGDVLTPIEAAALLKTTVGCMQSWRKRGTGPVFVRPPGAKPRYLRSDLMAWLEANRIAPINND